MAQTSFADLITNSELPVLVDFWADWCQPCRMLAPSVQRLAQELSGKLKVVKVDVDKNPQAGQAYGIQGIPTLILFHKGNVVWRSTGVLPYPKLYGQVTAALPA
jgi:thioredoxin